jgi:hypothetical protein
VASDLTVHRALHEIRSPQSCDQSSPRPSPRCARRSGSAPHRPREPARSISISTHPWSRSTRRTSSRPQPPIREVSASTRCSASPMRLRGTVRAAASWQRRLQHRHRSRLCARCRP